VAYLIELCCNFSFIFTGRWIILEEFKWTLSYGHISVSDYIYLHMVVTRWEVITGVSRHVSLSLQVFQVTSLPDC